MYLSLLMGHAHVTVCGCVAVCCCSAVFFCIFHYWCAMGIRVSHYNIISLSLAFSLSRFRFLSLSPPLPPPHLGLRSLLPHFVWLALSLPLAHSLSLIHPLEVDSSLTHSPVTVPMYSGCGKYYQSIIIYLRFYVYVVATIGRIDKVIGLSCRISSLW